MKKETYRLKQQVLLASWRFFHPKQIKTEKHLKLHINVVIVN